MSDRVEMSLEDVKKFTAHTAQQNEIKNRQFFKNLGKMPEDMPAKCDPAEAIAATATGDGM